MFTNYSRFILTIILVVMLAGAASAVKLTRRTGAGNLAHRTRLELGFGIRSHSDHVRTYSGWDEVDVLGSSGTVGTIGVSYWDNENIAYTLSYSLHDIEHDSWVDDWGYDVHETTVVQSLMFGIRYYLPQSRPYSAFRPYLSAAAGAFIGTDEYGEESCCGCDEYSEVHTMTVAGARLGGGVDLLMGRRFMVGLTGGYNFAEKFPRAIGGRRDYSGSEFGLSFSYLFGGGRR